MSNFQIQFGTVQKAGNIRLGRLVVPDMAHGLMKLFFISTHKEFGGFAFQPPFFTLGMTERFALLVVVNIRGHAVSSVISAGCAEYHARPDRWGADTRASQTPE